MSRKSTSSKQQEISHKQRVKKVTKKESDEVKPRRNEERFYCTNANLLHEMFKWKNSTKQGLKVLKNVKGKLVPTEFDENTEEKHEKYKKGTKYFIQFTKDNERYTMERKEGFKFVSVGRKYVVEDVTEIVERMGYAFDIDDNEEHRTISEELARMMIQIAEKVSNHSFFRNYNQWDKEEMRGYAYEKIIRGLPNYSFKFTNVFAYFTQACFNSFKSILSKHYKQVNIKRALTKKAMVDLQSSVPGSSMEKCLGNQFRGNDYDDFSEF